MVRKSLVSFIFAGFCATLTVLSGPPAWGYYNLGSFFRSSASPATAQLVFTTSAQTIANTWTCSGVLTIQNQNLSGTPTNITGTALDVSLSGANIDYFSDSSCANLITATTIAVGANTRNVYFQAGKNGTVTTTAVATERTSANQNHTITNILARTWIGGASCNGTWSTGACWQGGAAPSAAQTATFDTNCTTNCAATLGANASFANLRIHTGATTSVALSTYTMTLSTHLYVDGGTLSGNTGAITVGQNMVMRGGSFTFPPTLTVRRSLTVTGGTPTTTGSTLVFDDNNGCNGTYTITPGTIAYNNVSFVDTTQNCSGTVRTLPSGNTMQVAGTLTLGTSSLGQWAFLNGPGVVVATGPVSILNQGVITEMSNPVLIRLAGSGNQAITATGTTAYIPTLEIASTGGTLTFSGTTRIVGTYTYTSGTVDFATNNSTIAFDDPYNCNPTWNISPGSLQLHNASFLDTMNGCSYPVRTLTNGSTLNVGGSLTLGANANNFVPLNLGTIAVSGNLSVLNMGMGTNNGTTPTLIKLVGSSNQAVSATGSTAFIPSLEIASTGGTVTFSGSLRIMGNFTYTSGAADFATNNATLVFEDPYNCTPSWAISPGALVYGNVSFLDSTPNCNNSTRTFSPGSTMQVAGTVTFGGTATGANGLNQGTIAASGDVNILNKGIASTNNGSPGLLRLTGSANQTITATGATAYIPGLEIAKSGGTATFIGTTRVVGNYTYTSGNVDFTTNSATLALDDPYGCNFTWNLSPGALALNNVSLNDSTTNCTAITRVMPGGSTLQVDGALVLGSGSPAATTLSTGTISARGNVSVTGKGMSGTGRLSFEGTNATTLTIASGASLPTGAVTVNKPGSTLTLASNASFNGSGQTFTLTAGTVAQSGYNLRVNSTLTMSAGTVINEGGSCSAGSGTACSGSGFPSNLSTYLQCGSCVGCTGTASITCP